jgi:hypothetical protein
MKDKPCSHHKYTIVERLIQCDSKMGGREGEGESERARERERARAREREREKFIDNQ